MEWNALRKAINNKLLTYKVNEDKRMGSYFISKKNLPESEMVDPTVFARIFKNIGDFDQTQNWYFRALEIDRRIDEKQKFVKSAFALSASMLMLRDVHIQYGAYEKTDQMYAEVVWLRKRILANEDTNEHQKQYGEAVLARGTALLLNGEIGQADKRFAEAKEVFGNLAEKYGTIEA